MTGEMESRNKASRPRTKCNSCKGCRHKKTCISPLGAGSLLTVGAPDAAQDAVMPLASGTVGGVVECSGNTSKLPFVSADLALKDCGHRIASVLQDQWDEALLAPFEVAGSASRCSGRYAGLCRSSCQVQGSPNEHWQRHTPALCRGAQKLRQDNPDVQWDYSRECPSVFGLKNELKKQTQADWRSRALPIENLPPPPVRDTSS